MKLFCLTALLAFSLQAVACPDLSGQFVCTLDDGSTEDWGMTFRDDAGVRFYRIDGLVGLGADEYAADGRWNLLADTQDLKDQKLKLTCPGADLQLEMVYDYYYRGKKGGNVQFQANLTATGPDQFNMKMTGKLTSISGGEPIEASGVCDRK